MFLKDQGTSANLRALRGSAVRLAFGLTRLVKVAMTRGLHRRYHHGLSSRPPRRDRRRPAHAVRQVRHRLQGPLRARARATGGVRAGAARGDPPAAIDQIVFGTGDPVGQRPEHRARGRCSPPACRGAIDALLGRAAPAPPASRRSPARPTPSRSARRTSPSPAAPSRCPTSPIMYSPPLAQALVAASRGRTHMEKLQAVPRASRRRTCCPCRRRIAEYSTGLTMGESRREDGEGERHHPRGAGRVRAPLAHARRARVGGGHFAEK